MWSLNNYSNIKITKKLKQICLTKIEQKFVGENLQILSNWQNA